MNEQQKYLFGAGAILLGVVLVYAWRLTFRRKRRSVPPEAMRIIRIATALGAAAIGGGLLGFVEISGQIMGLAIKAGGAFALLLLVYYVNPPSWVVSVDDGEIDVGGDTPEDDDPWPPIDTSLPEADDPFTGFPKAMLHSYRSAASKMTTNMAMLQRLQGCRLGCTVRRLELGVGKTIGKPMSGKHFKHVYYRLQGNAHFIETTARESGRGLDVHLTRLGLRAVINIRDRENHPPVSIAELQGLRVILAGGVLMFEVFKLLVKAGEASETQIHTHCEAEYSRRFDTRPREGAFNWALGIMAGEGWIESVRPGVLRMTDEGRAVFEDLKSAENGKSV